MHALCLAGHTLADEDFSHSANVTEVNIKLYYFIFVLTSAFLAQRAL